MIFLTVGSQKFQFNRLLKEIDRLISKEIITDRVVAQIGASDYKPINYEYFDFLTKEEFMEYIDQSSLIITHGGTGVIINALKKNKKIIAIPRLSKFDEHVDDHQVQLINEFKELNFIEPVYDIDELENAINKAKIKKYNKYISNTKRIIDDIVNYLGEDDE
ncbi:PssE/Cps14G family polysaccharide biosynthesis glycosyltransferase [uncultured Clostridium sp.]|uniref:PssE/Cps14G family polysaccharide biosynthesis glycosyltransferase n=1 Tax=uncultured Clostridium sp. TaxID=59620 RepID=UPI0026DB4548|nr:PssE/Cps14G family polysaccharide biosynthesis glycosyltransferase [uncultured Clostridium sp.]